MKCPSTATHKEGKKALAAGPDMIRPIVLKELQHEILDLVSLIFQKSLDSGQLPSDWTKANVSPQFKKVTLATQQTIGLYH